MKNLLFTKNAFAGFLIILSLMVVLTFSACNNNPKSEDTKEVATEHNEAKFENTKETDAQFLVNAAEMNLEEIQLGQLAQYKGSMAHVKELGRMMEKGHTSSLKEVQVLAGKKQISLPASLTNDGQLAYQKLVEKTAADFEKAYADRMVDSHKAAIKKFEAASTGATDLEIRAWAASMLPLLRTRLDSALTCQAECQKM